MPRIRPLEHALDELLGIEQVSQFLADLVDQLLLPHQAAVREHDGAMLDGALEGREELVGVERLGHEGERVELVRRDRRRQRRAPRDDDDLRVGRVLADRADRVETGIAAQR